MIPLLVSVPMSLVITSSLTVTVQLALKVKAPPESLLRFQVPVNVVAQVNIETSVVLLSSKSTEFVLLVKVPPVKSKLRSMLMSPVVDVCVQPSTKKLPSVRVKAPLPPVKVPEDWAKPEDVSVVIVNVDCWVIIPSYPEFMSIPSGVIERLMFASSSLVLSNVQTSVEPHNVSPTQLVASFQS